MIVHIDEGKIVPEFFDGMRAAFDIDTILHNYNYQIPEEELRKLRTSYQDWRKELKEGDMVDAI